jgi:aldose 1-epimerase
MLAYASMAFPSSSPNMAIRSEHFGTTADGASVELYTLTNPNGLEARIATYGGTLQSLRTPDRDGAFADVVLGFDTLAPYLGDHPYFGSLIGRYANRIRGGAFALDGVQYRLPCNDGANHLHGGPRGFHTVVWQAQADEEGESLTLRYRSADGDEGYPGALEVEVRYTLADANALVLDYTARADAPTILNLTNHAYFNLAGAGTIHDHVLELAAERYLPVDASLVPTGELRAVRGTPFDFTRRTPMGERLGTNDEQLRHARGYDHNWVLDKNGGGETFAAEVSEPSSGRRMTVHTTQPGVQIYSGNFLDGTVRGKNGVAYEKHAGFCLETQHFPDSPNQPAFPSTVLRPGEVYRERTRYCFSVAD